MLQPGRNRLNKRWLPLPPTPIQQISRPSVSKPIPTEDRTLDISGPALAPDLAIETKQEKNSDSKVVRVIKDIYSKEGVSALNSLAASGLSVIGTALFASTLNSSSSMITQLLVSIGPSALVYYCALYGQFIYRDRNILKTPEGKKAKLKEYGAQLTADFAFIGQTYYLFRSALHAGMQAMGAPVPIAATSAHIISSVIYAALVPPLRYGMRKLFSDKLKDSGKD